MRPGLMEAVQHVLYVDERLDDESDYVMHKWY